MIPLTDNNPTSRRVLLVPMLIAANVIIYLFIQPSFAGDDREGIVEQIGFNVCHASIPYEVVNRQPLSEANPSTLDGDGQVLSRFQAERCPGKSVFASILASLFFHGSLMHLGGNMLYLWVFGNNIEDRLGIGRFALFYLVAGIAATYAQSLLTPSSPVPLIGASGAVAGILGAYLLLYPRARVHTLVFFFIFTVAELPAALLLGAWFLLQLLQGFGPGATTSSVAHFAHIGGFLAGMALLAVFRPRPRSLPRGW